MQKKYAAVHPGLYLSVLENDKYATESCKSSIGDKASIGDKVSIGIEAMNTIPEKYIMRSRAALKTILKTKIIHFLKDFIICNYGKTRFFCWHILSPSN